MVPANLSCGYADTVQACTSDIVYVDQVNFVYLKDFADQDEYLDGIDEPELVESQFLQLETQLISN